ncbi:hypothetical protein [Legionella tunisiensis]|uniref:hypothetical protein n=1 Tax=Legionella tunisiensis TaxID=1034944 RepID=UPI0003655429|nr:hypothetical protein [Legionella tunisiensis]
MPKIKAIKISKSALEQHIQSSSYIALYKILTTPVTLYTNVKDSLRTMNKKAPSKDEIQKSRSIIKDLLIKMHVNFEIQRQVLENVQNAKTLE